MVFLRSPWYPSNRIIFEIDANCVMKIGAPNKDMGKSRSIMIKNKKGRLSDEIERMVAEAEAMNSLSNFVYGIKN